MPNAALITGVAGQDGAYLARDLLERGYRVVGSSLSGPAAPHWRLIELKIEPEVEFIDFPLSDVGGMRRALDRFRPGEIYNFAAQSSVGLSFDRPLETAEIGGMSVARLLEAIRGADSSIRLFQASSCEMFERSRGIPQDESTPFYPANPYATAKAFAHWQTACYRRNFGLFGACAILFNHESPLRGRQFVSRKITLGLSEIKHGARDVLRLGSLDATRDWGFAGDYVRGMWAMLQAREPDDFVLATGVSTTVRQFTTLAAQCLGFALEWSGRDSAEVGVDRNTGKTIVEVGREFFRPTDAAAQVGNAKKAEAKIGWKPRTTLPELVAMMVEADERRVRNHQAIE